MIKVIAALASLSLAACQPAEPVNNTKGPEVALSPTPGQLPCGLADGTVVDEKLLYGAETAYNVPAHAYVTLDANGKLTPELKAQVRPLMIEAYRYLGLARAAYKGGNVCELNTAVAAAKDFANRAKALLPSSK